jgi:hypothetical protein
LYVMCFSLSIFSIILANCLKLQELNPTISKNIYFSLHSVKVEDSSSSFTQTYE